MTDFSQHTDAQLLAGYAAAVLDRLSHARDRHLERAEEHWWEGVVDRGLAEQGRKLYRETRIKFVTEQNEQHLRMHGKHE
jgi:hypothetical protein